MNESPLYKALVELADARELVKKQTLAERLLEILYQDLRSDQYDTIREAVNELERLKTL